MWVARARGLTLSNNFSSMLGGPQSHGFVEQDKHLGQNSVDAQRFIRFKILNELLATSKKKAEIATVWGIPCLGS